MNSTKESVIPYALFILLTTSFAVIAAYFPTLYIWLTYEDLFGEWWQFYLFAIALIVSARLALCRSEFALFFSLLALACLYVCGEEISWGQRLFNLETPQFFQQHNLQQETNLHNFITGPYDTGLKRAIETILAISLISFGAIYPQKWTNAWQFVRVLKRFIPPAPIQLWPFFCAGALLELRLLHFNEAELAEILIALALALYAQHYWLSHKQQQIKTNHTLNNKTLLTTLTIALICAALTSYTLFSLPIFHSQIDNRINKGMSKFAERYQRYNQWHHSLSLYTALLKKKPKSVSLLRKLALTQHQLGQTQQSDTTLITAIRLDMIKYSKDPNNAPLNLSLARSFKQAGNDERVAFHLQQAIDSSLRRTILQPNSANANYWLGRAHQQAGNIDEATICYERACQLEPTVPRYLRSLYKIRNS